MSPVVVFLVFWIPAVIAALMLGKRKGRSDGWAWGFVLGWLGVIIVACMSDKNAEKLTAKQREVAELEAELRLAELRKQQVQQQLS